MLEKDIENLIAEHPEDFFPGEGFRLIEQQHSVEGKRVDILFEDKLQRKIIVEVKRGILSREASGQVAEYYGLLKSKNVDTIYELVLCANIIPKERRVFLEHIGIECKELGIAYVSDIAKKYHYSFIDDTQTKTGILLLKPTEPDTQATTHEDNDITVWIFQANPKRYDILNALSDESIGNKKHWLVNQNKAKIKKGHIGLIWMSGHEAGIYAIARIDSNPMLMGQYEEEKIYWYDINEQNKESLRVELSIIKKLVNKPILKKSLMQIKELKNLSIIKQCQGTNFPVKNNEWEIISRFL